MRKSYNEIMEILNAADFEGMPEFNITVLRNIMLEPMAPYLKFHAMETGLQAKVSFGEYDNIFQEAVGAQGGVITEATECVMVFQQLEGASWDIARNFNALDSDSLQAEKDRLKAEAEAVVAGIRKQTDGMILWHGYESPVYPAQGIYDSQNTFGQQATVRELNDHLCSFMAQTPNAYFVDMDLCLRRVGARHFYDQRYWHMGRAPYTREALDEIAFEQAKFIRPLKGKNKKCLVLDCDNTLWGGIIGEDGMNGIKVGKTFPGSDYYEFQQQVIELYNRGVIVALCSKNNERDALEVLEHHPDMLLREKHVAAYQINWEDKAYNLRQLALDLNIGLDSMVFMDDSDFEVNLVRQQLPEVSVIHLPKNDSLHHRERLAACGLFDTLAVTGEDRQKGAMYKAEASRKKLKAELTDMNAYYKTLEMEVGIHMADSFAVPRIAQQTQKTNQFNLTTRRYNEADIARYIDSSDHDVIYLKLADRFGDSGIVGTCILAYEDGKAVFDTLLISCRVLGRGVEDAFMAHILARAKSRGVKVAVGEYYATKKNGQVEDFYARQGFSIVENGRADKTFEYNLAVTLPKVPDYFKMINSSIT